MAVPVMMVFDIPENPAWLAAWASVSLRHSQLDHILKMSVKTFADLSIKDALDAMAFNPSSMLRERVRKLARKRLGEGQPLLRLEAILERCRRLTEQRNALTHNIVARHIDGEEHGMQGHDQQWRPLPTTEELQALAADILRVTTELNTARLHGFLAEALLARGQAN